MFLQATLLHLGQSLPSSTGRSGFAVPIWAGALLLVGLIVGGFLLWKMLRDD